MRKITYSFTEVLEETENKSHVDINLGSQLEKLFSRSTDCTHNPWTRKCTHLQKHAFSLHALLIHNSFMPVLYVNISFQELYSYVTYIGKMGYNSLEIQFHVGC